MSDCDNVVTEKDPSPYLLSMLTYSIPSCAPPRLLPLPDALLRDSGKLLITILRFVGISPFSYHE
jgi:hypothetical protein